MGPHCELFRPHMYEDNDADGEQSPWNRSIPLEKPAFESRIPSSHCARQPRSWHQKDSFSELVWPHLIAVSAPSYITSQPCPGEKPMPTNLRRARRVSASDLKKHKSRR